MPFLNYIEDATITPILCSNNECEQKVFAYATREFIDEVKLGSGSIVRTLVIQIQQFKYTSKASKWYQLLEYKIRQIMILILFYST